MMVENSFLFGVEICLLFPGHGIISVLNHNGLAKYLICLEGCNVNARVTAATDMGNRSLAERSADSDASCVNACGDNARKNLSFIS